LAKVEAVADELVSLDPARVDQYLNLDDYVTQVGEAAALYIDTSAKIRDALAAPPAPTVQGAQAGGGPATPRPRPVDALKPATLTRDTTHAVFRVWTDSLNAYFKASHFELASKTEQHAYALACIDSYLINRIRPSIRPTTDVFGDGDTIIGFLRKELDRETPIFVRRQRFFSSRQSKGQRFSDWTNGLRAAGDECALSELTPDNILALMYVLGCIDNDLKEKLLETDGSLEQMIKAVADYEVRKVMVSSTSQSGVHGISVSPNQCNGCGGPCKDRKLCPAAKSTCTWCLLQGHWSTVCLSKKAGKPKATKPPNSKPGKGPKSSNRESKKPSSSLSTADKSSHTGVCKASACSDGNFPPTPRLDVTVNGHKVNALPDTGATRTVFPAKLVKELGIKVNKNVTANVTTANDQSMRCMGSATVELQR
jgi:hypothetical protein